VNGQLAWTAKNAIWKPWDDDFWALKLVRTPAHTTCPTPKQGDVHIFCAWTDKVKKKMEEEECEQVGWVFYIPLAMS